jgi:hypothetical protein
MMSLRSTSRRFRSQTRRQKPTRHDMNDMKARLKRDHYHKLAEAEPTDITTLNELLCSYCRLPHPRSLFQREEANKSPHIRWCMGWSRIFRACSHVSADRIWVINSIFGTGHPKSKRVNPLCDRCNMNFFLDRQYCNNHVVYGVESVLSKYHISSTIHRAAIQNDLQRLAALVCPHMRTDDSDFLERVLSSPCGVFDNDYNNGRPINDVFADSFVSNTMQIFCLNKRCNSTIVIERPAEAGRVPVKIRIRRDLGQMTDVLDPKWLIQLEK